MGLSRGNYPSEALAYQGNRLRLRGELWARRRRSIGNHNFEVIGPLQGTGANGIDADPAQVIYDFLTNPQYGAGFDASKIDMTTLYGGGSGRRTKPPGLLRCAGNRLFARARQRRARVVDPHSLAADLQLRRGLVRWPAALHPLRRRGNLCGQCHAHRPDGCAATVDRPQQHNAAERAGLRAKRVRERRRRQLRLHRRRARLHRRDERRQRRNIRHRQRGLCLRRRRRGPGRLRSPTPMRFRRGFAPEPDADLLV